MDEKKGTVSFKHLAAIAALAAVVAVVVALTWFLDPSRRLTYLALLVLLLLGLGSFTIRARPRL